MEEYSKLTEEASKACELGARQMINRAFLVLALLVAVKSSKQVVAIF